MAHLASEEPQSDIDNYYFDLSSTIMAGKGQEKKNTEKGAISKNQAENTQSLPPEVNRLRQEQIGNAQRDERQERRANEAYVKDLVIRSNVEYRAYLENSVEQRIVIGIQKGIAEIMKTLNLTQQSGNTTRASVSATTKDKDGQVEDMVVGEADMGACGGLPAEQMEVNSNTMQEINRKRSLNNQQQLAQQQQITQQQQQVLQQQQLLQQQHFARTKPLSQQYPPQQAQPPQQQQNLAWPQNTQNRRDQHTNNGQPSVTVNIDKWGVVFEGSSDDMSIDDFIFRVEHLKSQYGCSWHQVIRDFHLLVRGVARDWYWLFVKANNATNWPTLREALRRQFQGNRSEFELMRDMVERKQRSGESVEAYFYVMYKLRSKLKNPVTERDMIKIIKRNLRENLAIRIYPMTVYNVDHLRDECMEAEALISRQSSRSTFQQPQRYSQPRGHNANEIMVCEYDDDQWPTEEDMHVEELQQSRQHKQPQFQNVVQQQKNSQQHQNTQPQEKRVIICWNCHQPGHVYMDCTSLQRNIFCYKCGLKDVITPKCPNCATGNFPRNVMSAGVSRSSQTPANY